MASYTIEDIELIRRKSGISYQEAVALLDYHNGNVARALVDLERNGRIKNESGTGTAKADTKKSNDGKAKSGLMSFFSKMYQFRLYIKKDNITIANISLLFAIPAAIFGNFMTLVAAILVLALGYKISFNKKDPNFAGANLEKMVRSASENVKSTVSSFAKNFDDAGKDEESTAEEPVAKEDRSYYQSNPAATTYHTPYTGSAPTIQVPVQVETQEGSVSVQDDPDGFTNATIE